MAGRGMRHQLGSIMCAAVLFSIASLPARAQGSGDLVALNAQAVRTNAAADSCGGAWQIVWSFATACSFSEFGCFCGISVAAL
ncbi:MAG: hypothetical protein SH859_05520 [Hyphomicrobium aestuarii]|nr:hypothetical protein [Hyphomicrobium aestuarii]